MLHKVKKKYYNNLDLIKSIIRMSLPAVGEMSLNTLLGIADTLMISWLISKSALAAVGFANQIMFTLIFIFTSFNTGATAMISRSYGAKDYKQLRKIAGQTISINIILGIIITTLSYVFNDNLFNIYDMSNEVFNLTLSYFNIVAFAIIFMFISFSSAAILRGSGDTKTPMKITGIANLINVFGNYVLITGFWIFPELGIKGAALSTTISRGVAMILYIRVLSNKNNQVYLRLKNFMLSSSIIKPLWKISYPGAIEQTLMQTSFIVVGVIVSSLDTTSEAAFRILINIESISFMPAVGISIATATLVGKAIGEKDNQLALKTGNISASLGILWGIFIGTLFIIFPKQILNIYTPDKTLINISILAMTLAGFNQPGLNFMIVMSGALRGAGDTNAVMRISALRLWGVFIPISYLCISYLGTNFEGVWIAEITSFAIFSIVTYKRFNSRKWEKIKF